MTFKVMMFVRRHPELIHLSQDEFIYEFETKRMTLAKKLFDEGVLPPYVTHRRNYIRRNDPVNMNFRDQMPFDLITEGVFHSREDWEASLRGQQGGGKQQLYQDPKNLVIDPDSRRYLYVVEKDGPTPQPDPE